MIKSIQLAIQFILILLLTYMFLTESYFAVYIGAIIQTFHVIIITISYFN